MDAKKAKQNRGRYVQLAQIAVEVLEFLDGKKVEHHERCIVRRIAEDLSNQEAALCPPSYVGLATANETTCATHGMIGEVSRVDR